MIVLDTNVISAMMQASPDERVVDWLNSQPSESIWTTSVSLFEILYGINSLAKGTRRQALQAAFELAMQQDLDGRVLDFDSAAAVESARISSKLRSCGQTVEMRDVQIAGIVSARQGTLATRNTKHFDSVGISLVNPWEVR